MSTIGERIAELRLRRGMTQSDLGDAIGESKQTIYKYEHGIITNIPLPKVEAIAKALRCPPVALTGWVEKEPEQEPENDFAEFIEQLRQLSPAMQQVVLAQLQATVQAQKAQGAPQGEK